MKVSKSVSFKISTLSIIREHMQIRNNDNFSEIVCALIAERDKFYAISMELQGKKREKIPKMVLLED